MRLIDADELMKHKGNCYDEEGHLLYAVGTGNIMRMPTIDAVPVRHGKWILVHEADETGNATYECSICHRGEIHVPIVEVGYCWHCGARMDGRDETD